MLHLVGLLYVMMNLAVSRLKLLLSANPGFQTKVRWSKASTLFSGPVNLLGLHARYGGVGFAVSNKLVQFMAGNPQCFNHRVMTIRLKLKSSLKVVTFVTVYAPTFKAKQLEKEAFYQDLQKAINTVSPHDLLIVLGDFNARVGSDWKTWKGVVGSEGISEVNSNDLGLLEFCFRNGLCKKVARSCSVYDKSGSHLITDPSEIRDCWKRHFDEVFNFSTYSFNNSVLSLVPQQPTIESLAIPPTIAEVKEALSRMKCRCAAGKDGISAELLIFGGEDVIIALHSLFMEIWSSEQVPKQWVDSVIVPVPKKGDLHCCDNWRGISLLNVAGKVFTRPIADRISDISESIIDETQCGFRKQHGTVDMVFVARQLQEKAREQNCQLFMCFFDLKIAYDSVPRDALWCLRGKLGFPAKMVNIIKQLHFGMEASVCINGVLSNPFSVSNGLKQGCVLAPFLFNLYFNKVMQDALKEF